MLLVRVKYYNRITKGIRLTSDTLEFGGESVQQSPPQYAKPLINLLTGSGNRSEIDNYLWEEGRLQQISAYFPHLDLYDFVINSKRPYPYIGQL